MTETVKVTFEGSVTVGVAGTMTVPKALWEQKSDDENWSLDLQKHVEQMVDGDHMDTGDFNDVEIDDIRIAD